MPNPGAYVDQGRVSDEAADRAPSGMLPFAQSSYQYREKMRTDTVLMSTSQQPQQAINVTPGGFLRGIWIEVSGTGGVLGTAVAGTPSDLPWGSIVQITLEDVNGQAIVGPIDGDELYLANKFGGYWYQGDPATHPAFVGSAAGIFTTPYFVLWLPVEIRSDALGSLANTDARAQYRLIYTVESSANVLSTGTVTTQPTLTITTWVDYWAQVEPVSMTGEAQEQRPPHLGTTQFWYREIPTVAAGAQTVKHNRVGNAIRNIIYVLRNGAAATGAQPANQRVNGYTDPIKQRLDNRYLFSESPNLRRRAITPRRYALTGTDGDPSPLATPAVGYMDTGVLVYTHAEGLDYHTSPADEGRWLDTNEAQLLQLEVSYTGTVATQTILTNDVAPPAV